MSILQPSEARVKAATPLVHGTSADADLLISGAHVLDPRSDLDAPR